MIVVVGTPAWRSADPAAPTGRACEIAVAAAGGDRRVELVGRTGDDDAGDALLLALSRAGVGHVALLRDPARPTPIVVPADDADVAIDDAFDESPAASMAPPATPPPAPDLDAADVALGLGYLTTFDVLVVTDDVTDAVRRAAIEASAFAGARLVLLVTPAVAGVTDSPTDATVLAVPEDGDDGSFTRLVGAYAASLDDGVAPGAAFEAAVGAVGWEALEPSA